MIPSCKMAALIVLIIICGLNSATCLSQRKKFLQIQTSGIWAVEDGDIAVVLYANVSNQNTGSVHATVSIKQCCLYSKYAGSDCKTMRVIGGYDGELGPAETRNIKFVYPTLYPHDLEGGCELQLSDGRWIRQHHTIMFNTSRPSHPTYGWLIDTIMGELFGSMAHACRSVDEDNLRACQPVDCVHKYHGNRNHFDKSTRRCVAVPNCVTNTPDRQDLPIKAYDTINNRCKVLSLHLSEGDIQMMMNTHQKTQTETVDWRVMRRVNCHHGYHKPDKSGCICDPGWMSLPVNFQRIDPKKSVIHMCNIKESGSSYWIANIYIILLTVTIVSVILILVSMTIYVGKKMYPEHQVVGGLMGKYQGNVSKNDFEFLHRFQAKSPSMDDTGISEDDLTMGTVSTHIVGPPTVGTHS